MSVVTASSSSLRCSTLASCSRRSSPTCFSNCASAVLICFSRKLARSCRSPRISRIKIPLTLLTSTPPQAEQKCNVRTKGPPTAVRHKRKTRYAKERQPQLQPRRSTVILRASCCRVSRLANNLVSPRIGGSGFEQSSPLTLSTAKFPKTRPRRLLNRICQHTQNGVINLSNDGVRRPCALNFSGAEAVLACRSLAGRRRAGR